MVALTDDCFDLSDNFISVVRNDDCVTDFTLVDAFADSDLGPINDGDVIDLSNLPTNQLNIRANVSGSDIKSVRFGLNGNNNVRTENAMPYALGGDAGANYFPINVSPGTYTITATPYKYPGAGGMAGMSSTITITVINSSARQSSFTNAVTRLNVYPNPVVDQVVLDMVDGRDGNVRLEVYNLHGNRVQFSEFKTMSTAWSYKLNLDDLPAGTYMIHVVNEDVQVSKRIVKK